MSLQTIKNKLVTVMTELTGSGQPLNAAYGFQNPSPREYPAAFISSFSGMRKQRYSSASDLVTYRFVIRIVIPTGNDLAEEDKICSIIDAVISKFTEEDNVDTLDGVCDSINIVSIDPFSDQTENPIRGVDIFVECGKLKAIT